MTNINQLFIGIIFLILFIVLTSMTEKRSKGIFTKIFFYFNGSHYKVFWGDVLHLPVLVALSLTPFILMLEITINPQSHIEIVDVYFSLVVFLAFSLIMKRDEDVLSGGQSKIVEPLVHHLMILVVLTLALISYDSSSIFYTALLGKTNLLIFVFLSCFIVILSNDYLLQSLPNQIPDKLFYELSFKLYMSSSLFFMLFIGFKPTLVSLFSGIIESHFLASSASLICLLFVQICVRLVSKYIGSALSFKFKDRGLINRKTVFFIVILLYISTGIIGSYSDKL